MTGHSFGAVTTQAVSDQKFLGRTAFTDPRIKAALAMSTAFWDTYLRGDERARLAAGRRPRSVLERKDRWQHK